jgi:hypothetical protein
MQKLLKQETRYKMQEPNKPDKLKAQREVKAVL